MLHHYTATPRIVNRLGALAAEGQRKASADTGPDRSRRSAALHRDLQGVDLPFYRHDSIGWGPKPRSRRVRGISADLSARGIPDPERPAVRQGPVLTGLPPIVCHPEPVRRRTKDLGGSHPHQRRASLPSPNHSAVTRSVAKDFMPGGGFQCAKLRFLTSFGMTAQAGWEAPWIHH